jgi:hypothetical protein
MKKIITVSLLCTLFALIIFSFTKSKNLKNNSNGQIKQQTVECTTNITSSISPLFQPITPSPILIRKNFDSLLPNEKNNIRYAIGRMKSLSATNPLSWKFQVRIHNGPSDTGKPFKTCEHGSCFFLAWHRMYLFFFERIMIKNMKNGWPKPALPYWEYTDAIASRTIVPSYFRIPSTTGANSLYQKRNRDMNHALSPIVMPVSYKVTFDNAVNYNTDYYSFQQAIENAHGAVHTDVGTWTNTSGITSIYAMFDPATAATDPLFFLHHTNVDRYWEKWLALGGDRKNPSATCDRFWWNKTFEFYDSTGIKVSLRGQDIVKINNQMMLNYKYKNIADNPFIDTRCEISKTECPKMPSALFRIPKYNTRINGPKGSISFNTFNDLKIIEDLKKLSGKNEKLTDKYDVYIEFSNITYNNPPAAAIEVYVNPRINSNEQLNPYRKYFAGLIDLFTPKAVDEHGNMQHTGGIVQPYVQRVNITSILKEQNFNLATLQEIVLSVVFRGSTNSNGLLNAGDLLIGNTSIAIYQK